MNRIAIEPFDYPSLPQMVNEAIEHARQINGRVVIGWAKEYYCWEWYDSTRTYPYDVHLVLYAHVDKNGFIDFDDIDDWRYHYERKLYDCDN